MKKKVSVFLYLLAFMCVSTAAIANDAQDKACIMVLCLYGEKTGVGGQIECGHALAAYKKIMKKSKRTKKIMCEQTKERRLAKLATCPQDEYDIKQLVDCDE